MGGSYNYMVSNIDYMKIFVYEAAMHLVLRYVRPSLLARHCRTNQPMETKYTTSREYKYRQDGTAQDSFSV